MSTTDELRALLDERGVEYEATNENVTTVYLDDSAISYFHQKGKFSAEIIVPRPRLNATEWLSPEQVIEATLGRGACRFETVVPFLEKRRSRADLCECDRCGYRCARGFIRDESFKYCPNCGRKVVFE